MKDDIRVAIVDDHPLFREGVILTIQKAQKFKIAAEGATMEDALRIAREERPDMMLLDVSVARSALEDVREIVREHPRAKFIVLTALDDGAHVSRTLNAGVNGYVLKGVRGAELLQIMETVYGGGYYVSPDLAWRLLAETRQPTEPLVESDAPPPSLSQRELQVLDHSCRGLTNPEIAANLGVSVRTVKYYKTLLFGKMRVRNRIEAMLMAQKLKMN